jgi:hypothetical protein
MNVTRHFLIYANYNLFSENTNNKKNTDEQIVMYLSKRAVWK